MSKTKVAIIGSGNIGTDLMIKIMRLSKVLEMAVMVGIDPASDGLARAARIGVATTHDGIDGLIAMPEFADVEIVFDATSAGAHSRIADWDIGIVDTIADNASAGRFVLGTRPVPLSEIDLRMCGMVLEKNGESVSFGAGAACLGNPLHALGWLTSTLARLGRPLVKGDIVLSGALGPMTSVAPGDHVEMRINGLGSVRVGFCD